MSATVLKLLALLGVIAGLLPLAGFADAPPGRALFPVPQDGKWGYIDRPAGT